MHHCPYFSRCPLPDKVLLTQNKDLVKEYLHTPGVLTTDDFSKSYAKRYCNATYTQCARFKVVDNLGINHLPENLLPHQIQRAQQILHHHL